MGEILHFSGVLAQRFPIHSLRAKKRLTGSYFEPSRSEATGASNDLKRNESVRLKNSPLHYSHSQPVTVTRERGK